MSEARASPSGDVQFELLVLGECDSFDEAISFMAALEMMDGAVATFEVMLLIGCSDEHPGHFEKVLEALCVDHTRSSRCTRSCRCTSPVGRAYTTRRRAAAKLFECET